MICPRCYPPDYTDAHGILRAGYRGFVKDVVARRVDGKVIRRCEDCGWEPEIRNQKKGTDMKLTIIEKPHPPQEVMEPHLDKHFGPQEPEPPYPFGIALYGSAVYFESTTRWQTREDAEAAGKLFLRGAEAEFGPACMVRLCGRCGVPLESCSHFEDQAEDCWDRTNDDNCPQCGEPIPKEGTHGS